MLVILLLLGVFDLYAGVANDAVNFTNSAVGSKVASFKVIMIFASAGIIIGVTFSSGMMEVARKGIFNPEYFNMPEILMIFIAVMIADVLLLDLFSTFGLPTSTTVSILCNLLGGSLAFATWKITNSGENFEKVFLYINTSNVLKIFTAIFISIAVAFIAGAIVQYIARIIFTFDTSEKVKRYGAVWGGLSMTFISFFVILKGIKGASFLTNEIIEYVQNNIFSISLYLFLGWTVLLLFLQFITKVNILKIIVIAGTFALAMAFAANDLVNFIGAPLAGLNAYQLSSLASDPTNTNMAILNEPIKTDTMILLAMGIIMTLTLWISKKARTVTQTEVGLGSQEEVYELFQSNAIARSLVKMVIFLFDLIGKIVPVSLKNWIHSRFERAKLQTSESDGANVPSFDLIRASAILMVSSALISFATSLKLPLSTTYVTFIVAMAAAFSDRSWGRDSAVYRVSGVVTVVGGWFMTALMAIIASFIIGTLVFYGKIYVIIILLAIGIFIYLKTNQYHKNKQLELTSHEKKIKIRYNTPEDMISGLSSDIASYIIKILDILTMTIKGTIKTDLKLLKKANKINLKNNETLRLILDNILLVSRLNSDESIDSSQHIIKSIASLNTISDRLSYLTKHNFNYFDNNHVNLNHEQTIELKDILSHIHKYYSEMKLLFENNDYGRIEKIQEFEKLILSDTTKFTKNQLKRMKKPTMNLKRSRLFINNLENTSTIIKHTTEILGFSKESILAMRS